MIILADTTSTFKKVTENWSTLTADEKTKLWDAADYKQATFDDLKSLDAPFKILIKEG